MKPVLRYDYFETPVTIHGQEYIAKFDVEALPGANNYRTHQIIKIDLTQPEASLVGPAPTASSSGSSPLEGTRPLKADFIIPQGMEFVKPVTRQDGGDIAEMYLRQLYEENLRKDLAQLGLTEAGSGDIVETYLRQMYEANLQKALERLRQGGGNEYDPQRDRPPFDGR